jgi:HK97 family phage major capsid protein
MKIADMRRKAGEAKAKAEDILRTMDSRLDSAESFPEDSEFTSQTEAADKLVAESKKWTMEADKREALERSWNAIDAASKAQKEKGYNGTYDNPLPHDDAGNAGNHEYSLLRAVRLISENKALDGLEGEVHTELVKRAGREAETRGFRMPHNLKVRPSNRGGNRVLRGDLDTTTGVGGLYKEVDSSIIELFRNRTVLVDAGARMLTDMVGTFDIPRQTGAGVSGWVTENNAATKNNQTLDAVSFTPRTVMARTLITRKFMKQVSFDAENFVREDLATVLALAIDSAGLVGPAASANPVGLLYNTNVPLSNGATGLGTNGGALTWALTVLMETLINSANADIGNLAYIGNSKVKGHAKTTLKAASTAEFLYQAGAMNEYPLLVTNSIPSNLVKASSGATLSALFFGNWAELVIAMWGGFDVVVDNVTDAAGGKYVTIYQDCDIKPRHDTSFTKYSDVAAG